MNPQRANQVMGLGGGGGGCCTLCSPFLNIQPLIHSEYGTQINPLFDVAKIFRLSAEPFPLTVPPGETLEVSLVAQAEENHMGDILVNELLARTDPDTARTAVTIRSQQNDRVFSNAPVLDRFVFGNSQMGGCLPCCFLIQTTNFVQIRIQNLEAVDTMIEIVARGRRFLPYQYPNMRSQMLAYWNSQMSVPYWLTIDRVLGGATPLDGSGVIVPAGGQVTVLMTVPGAGDFEAKELLAFVEGIGGAVDAGEILADIKEGVGRSIMDRALPLGDFLAQPNSTVAGLQGGELRAASGNHCRQYSQFFKRNTRVRVELENTGAFDARVFMAFKGCAHYYDECPPGRALERSLSLEPSIGPMLIEAPRCPPVHQFTVAPGQGMVPMQGQAPIVPPTGYMGPGSYAPPPGYGPPGMAGVEWPDGRY